MPKSRVRRRMVFTPPQERTTVRVGNPRWLVPVMLAAFAIGLLWIVVYYVSETEYPIDSLGAWNMAVGFGLILVGFFLSMRWR
ncbi:cell division protein CrgA [Motilibacter aurantiacus]|nr:cell division protein CrgA [Motilibacter aurantiacus]